MSVEQVFDKFAESYDQERRKFIPDFDGFYGVVLWLLQQQPNPPARVLDLGAGTGLLSSFIASAFPHVDMKLVDVSEGMLEQARRRFENGSFRPTYIMADYAHELPDETYDVVVSALSIHHLTHPQKARLFKSVYDHLVPGGLFINADQVAGQTASIDRLYSKHWHDHVYASGLTDTQIAAAKERMKEDKKASLERQLQWMTDAGYQDVNCWYQKYSFAVYAGVHA